MDVPRLDGLSKYWKQFPPVHVSMAAYVGWGKSKESAQDEGDFEALMASIPTKEFTPNG